MLAGARGGRYRQFFSFTSAFCISFPRQSDNTWLLSRYAPLAAKLMRHGVNNIVDADANAERGVLFRILGIVGVLPGIAQIHVMADGHHEAAFVVVDAGPMR